jgi:uncharacterized repeat protein (TIGR02543 family)
LNWLVLGIIWPQKPAFFDPGAIFTSFGPLGKDSGDLLTMGSEDIVLYAQWVLIPTYNVYYYGNANTGGTAPIDNTDYIAGDTVTVAGAGSLVREGYTFAGWNTSAAGDGTAYTAGATFTMGSASIDLHAQWVLIPTYNVTYYGNGNTGGSVTVDNADYENGETVTVANVGSLVRTGYSFEGWNTTAAGDGTAYAEGATFTMGNADVNLYAQWSLIPTYSVMYFGNGNTGGTAPSDGATYRNGDTVSVAAVGSLVREGYSFEGWNTAASGNGTAYSAGATFSMGDADVHLYAQWSLIPTYSVTYYGNGSTGGTPPTDSAFYANGESVTIASPGSLVRSGYTFAGWNTAAAGNGDAYAAGATLTMGDANVKLYAQWSLIPTYFVSYHGNGNTAGSSPIDSTAYENGESVTVGGSGTLVREGYSFAGWNSTDSGDGTDYSVGATFTIGSADVHLYAQWDLIPTYDVNYFGNGNTGGSAPVDSESYEDGESVTVADSGTLVREGYTFAGWNTAAAGNGTAYAAGATLTMGSADIILYAQWDLIPTYDVTYFGNGNTGGSAPTDGTSYENGESVTIAGPGTLVRSGYTFAGWNTLANGAGTAYAAGSTLIMGSADVNLYAQWDLIPTYSVTYLGNGSTGGSVPVDGSSYESGEMVTVAAVGTLVRSGYTFTGWNTTAGGTGTAYAPGATLTMGSADVNLYAQWELIPVYSVIYHGNGHTGGTVTTNSTQYPAGTVVTVYGPNDMVKEGYSFEGWNTQADGNGTDYPAGSNLTMGSADFHLYAVWEPIPTYQVTYNPYNASSGSQPVDTNFYEVGDTVTVLPPGDMSRTGYRFLRWNTSAYGLGTDYEVGETFPMVGYNLTLYPVWEYIPTYRVYYRGNTNTSGYAPSDSTKYLEGETATVRGPNSLAKTDHIFVGWNTVSDGSGTDYQPDDEITIGTSTIYLYAQWIIPIRYDVFYDKNGANGDAPVDNVRYMENELFRTKTSGNMIKPGYDFSGWNTAADGSGTSFIEGKEYPMGVSSLQLYAHWTPYPSPTPEEVFTGINNIGHWNWESGVQQRPDKVDADETHAFTLNDAGGISIFDISGAEPVPVSYLESPDGKYPNDIHIQGNTLYITYYKAFHIYDVTDRTNPVFLNVMSTTNDPQILESYGNSLAVGTRYGADLYDVSNPASPVFQKSYTIPDGERLENLEFKSDIIYLAADTKGVIALDSKASGDLEALPNASYLYPVGENSALDVGLSGSILYVADSIKGLYAIDVSDPLQSVLVAEPTDDRAYDVWAKNDYVYSSGNSIHFASGLNPDTPPQITEIGEFTLYGDDSGIQDAKMLNDRLLVVGANYGLTVLDISNPANPSEVGAYSMNKIMMDVAIDGDYLYAIEMFTLDEGQFSVYNISNLANPVKLQSLFLNGQPEALLVKNNVAYVALRSDPLVAIDISSPSTPEIVFIGDSSSWGRALYEKNDVLYLAYNWGLITFDISLPQSPVRLDSCLISGVANDLIVYGDYAYIPSGSWSSPGEIEVVDISDPSNPIKVSDFATPAGGESIDIHHGKLYFTYNDGFQVYDLESDRVTPTLLSTNTLSETSPLLDINGDTLYIAEGSRMRIYDTSNLSDMIMQDFSDSRINVIEVQGNIGIVSFWGGDPRGFQLFTIN